MIIAGSDSSGGAGIQADIESIVNTGCHAVTVITSLTAQNTSEVTNISYQDPIFFKTKGKSLGPITIIAIKTMINISNQPICGI